MCRPLVGFGWSCSLWPMTGRREEAVQRRAACSRWSVASLILAAASLPWGLVVALVALMAGADPEWGFLPWGVLLLTMPAAAIGAGVWGIYETASDETKKGRVLSAFGIALGVLLAVFAFGLF